MKLINSKELFRAKIIFESWKNICKQADTEIILTRKYSWSREEKQREYEKLNLTVYKEKENPLMMRVLLLFLSLQ